MRMKYWFNTDFIIEFFRLQRNVNGIIMVVDMKLKY